MSCSKMCKCGVEHKGRSIDDLPDEILEYIFCLVSPYKDSESCKMVCRRWAKMIASVAEHKKSDLYRAVLNSNIVWQCIVPPNLGPTTTITKRYSHSACYCDNYMYVFGGCTLRCTMFNDLWTLDLSNRKWIRPYSIGSYPSPKACASMCCYNKSLILFGGWTHPPPYPLHQIQRLFNELHTYDITSNTWSIIHTAISPPPMAGHSATIHGNTMVVFGGLQWGGSLFLYSSSNDLWCFNFETHCWTKPVVVGPKPKTRYGQSQIYLNEENLLIMGGCQGPNAILDDVWMLTMTDDFWVWTEMTVHNPQWAAPHLWCHPACKVGDLVVIFSSGTTQSRACHTFAPIADRILPPDLLAMRGPQAPVVNPGRDVNVNGQRGSLERRPAAEEPRPSTSSARDEPQSPVRCIFAERGGEPQPHFSGHSSRSNGELQMAAFRNDTSCPCPNHSRNRVKQLESLRRLEERLRRNRQPDKPKPEGGDDPFDPDDPVPGPSDGVSLNRLTMYVLDLSDIFEGHVTWRPPNSNWNAPRDTVFHSLVLGKGELIIFGGVQKNSSSATIPVASYKAVSNNTHVISAPRNVV